MFRCKALAWAWVWLLVASGCGTFRGIPSHGGGKRFDEEQRLISGAVRTTLAQMELKELVGKRVLLSLRNIAHVGGGNVVWPGLDTLNLHADFRTSDVESTHRNIYDGAYVDEDRTDSVGVGGSVGYRFQDSYYTQGSPTQEDMAYLLACLEMKAQHAGLQVVADQPQVILYVLVDVLGTNRSRRGVFLTTYDTLEATCEVTYYAADAATGELLFRARRAGGASNYREKRIFGADYLRVSRASHEMAPTPMPVDGEADLAAAPSPARGREPQADLAAPAQPTNGHTDRYLEALLQNARLQIQVGDREAATRSIQMIYSVDPSYPGLEEVRRDYRQKDWDAQDR